MKLKVIHDYKNRTVFYLAKSVIEVTEAEAAFLLNDAPGCFKKVEEDFTAPVDRIIRRNQVKTK